MNLKSPYRVCLVGALADIAKEHLNAIEALPQFSLVSVCDLDRERLAAKYSFLGTGSCFTDYKAAVCDPNIDVVVNATPNKLHGPVSIAALKAGKAVLCEKPMTHDLENAFQLKNIVDQYPNLFVVSYHFKFFPEVQYFRKEWERFGDIRSFKFISSEDLDIRKKWILDKTQGGPWLDWASNALSVLRQVLNRDELFDEYTILKVNRVRSPEYEIELKAEVQLNLNRIPGNIEVDWMAPKGSFTAMTVLINHNNDEIILNHASGEVLLNGSRYWAGEDRRYIDVYKDFYERLGENNSNFQVGMQDAEIIDQVQNYR